MGQNLKREREEAERGSRERNPMPENIQGPIYHHDATVFEATLQCKVKNKISILIQGE